MPKAQEKQQTIDEILGSLSLAQKETFQKLRSLISETILETVEIVKQGRVTYKLGEMDLVWISHFQEHFDLEFAMGASLASQYLKSRGTAQHNQNIRHVAIGNFVKLKPELARLLKEAAILGFQHCETK